jgi:hypothetical protein
MECNAILMDYKHILLTQACKDKNNIYGKMMLNGATLEYLIKR